MSPWFSILLISTLSGYSVYWFTPEINLRNLKWCEVILEHFWDFSSVQFSSVTESCPTLCDHMNCSTPGLPVHHQLLEFTQTRPSSRWCHPAISSSVVPFSSCPQSLSVSESFPMSQLFAWGGQSTGVPGSSPSGSKVVRSRDGVCVWGINCLIKDMERLEKNSVVGKLVEKKLLNNLVYVENQ